MTTMNIMTMNRYYYNVLILTFVVVVVVLLSANLANSTTTSSSYSTGHQNLHRRHSEEELRSSKVFIDCLNVPIEFVDESEENNCNNIVDSLTAKELDIAAKTSYAYWYLFEQQKQSTTTATILHQAKDYERQSALKEAKRHYIASNRHLSTAIERLQKVCDYRQEHQLDLLRVAFLNNDTDDDDDDSFYQRHGHQNQHNTTTQITIKQMKQYISNDMEKQAVIMRARSSRRRYPKSSISAGLSVENDDDNNQYHQQPIMIKYPRHKGGTTYEEYMLTQFYIAEKANAVIEYLSHGQGQQKMIAIFDFSLTSKRNSPPISWQISALQKIQLIYPERIEKLIVLEPPFWIRTLFATIKPFLSQTTSDKIQIVTDRTKLCGDILDCDDDNDDKNNNILSSIIDEEIDVHKYLNDTPFYCPYDYDPNSCNSNNNRDDNNVDDNSNLCCNTICNSGTGSSSNIN